MFVNAKVSEQLAVLATLNPVSQAAGTVLTAWVPVAQVHRLAAYIQTGAMGTNGTIDAKLVQAQDNTGTGAKNVVGFSGTTRQITQILAAAGNNVQAFVECMVDDIDANNGYGFVALSVTVGTAASVVGATLFAVPRYLPASGLNQAGVVQTV